MIPPRGFKQEQYPLHHKFNYSAGLNVKAAAQNSTMFTLVKNYTDATNDPTSIIVNPHHASFEVETGAICGPMSIIDKLRLTLKFNITENFTDIDNLASLNMSWMPIFFSFPEKLDAADDKTTTTVASILSLTKDATKEDITPAFATDLSALGDSVLTHPVSTANFAEVFGTLNLTTDLAMEGVPHNHDTFIRALRYYTNKGALKACVGKTRYLTLSKTRPSKTYHLNKFVPRAVRRIVPYSYFGILVHMPLATQPEQVYITPNPTTSIAHVGVKALVAYDEWNPSHIQDAM